MDHVTHRAYVFLRNFTLTYIVVRSSASNVVPFCKNIVYTFLNATRHHISYYCAVKILAAKGALENTTELYFISLL